MIRIIDHKKVDMTDDEFNLYQQICRDNDRDNFKGEYLFEDLFESDEKGFLTFLKPPKTYFTFEVIFFLFNLMQHQHLRRNCTELESVIGEARQTLVEARKLLQEVKNEKTS